MSMGWGHAKAGKKAEGICVLTYRQAAQPGRQRQAQAQKATPYGIQKKAWQQGSPSVLPKEGRRESPPPPSSLVEGPPSLPLTIPESPTQTKGG